MKAGGCKASGKCVFCSPFECRWKTKRAWPDMGSISSVWSTGVFERGHRLFPREPWWWRTNPCIKIYGAFDGGQLVGTLCIREPQHIGGFFVKADHHRKGIGRALFETMRRDYDKQEFTVNSSPYAVKVYEHLGFQATDTEQVVNGLRFTPMIYKSW